MSTNLQVATPTVAGVVNEIKSAVQLETDLESRFKGSIVNWACNWEDALDDHRMSTLDTWITEIRSQ